MGGNRPRRDNARTISDAFRAMAAKCGGRVALEDGGATVSFSELDRWANGVARAASESMVPGERAALLADNGVAAIAAFLGLCKARIVNVHLRPDQPLPYLRSILDDSRPRVIFTTREHRTLAESLHGSVGDILDLDEECFPRDTPPARSPHPDDRVAITYTSGSTGTPKGVIQTHQSTMAFVDDYLSRTRLRREDRVALLHDLRGMDLLASLVRGSSAHCYPIERRGLYALGDWLVDNRITVLPTVPSVLRSMLKALSGRRGELSVRLLRLSGEVLTPDDIRNAAAVFPRGCRVLNWFGSTEVAIASACFVLREAARTEPVPVGRPFAKLTVRIEDSNGRQTDGAGEIVVSGHSLFEGYWRRPDLDAERLSPDPVAPGRRRFRTGDIGYLDPHARLVVLGRLDGQLKINGYRVEAGEVEAALRSVAGIHDALVRLIRLDGGSESALAAYVVVDAGEPPLVGVIRRELAKRIPRYMIPGYFACIDAIPRLPGGKPDRRALPELVAVSRREYNFAVQPERGMTPNEH